MLLYWFLNGTIVQQQDIASMHNLYIAVLYQIIDFYIKNNTSIFTSFE